MVLLLPQHTETPVISCCSAILPAVWRVAAYLHQACRPALAWQRVLPSICCCSSVTKSCPTFCDPRVAALQPLCPLLSHEVCSRSWPLSQWCYLTISSSVIPFSFHFQSFPASGSFPMSCPFALGGPSIGASASASVLPMNIQGWFPLALTSLISLLSKGLSRVLHHHNLKASILQCSAFFMVQLSNLYLTTGKTIALTVQIFVGKVMSLLFNMLSRFVKVFLPSSKHLLI